MGCSREKVTLKELSKLDGYSSDGPPPFGFES